MKPQILNNLPIYRRLTQVSLSIGLLITVLNLWIGIDHQGLQDQHQRLSALVRQLTEQTHLNARTLMINQQWTELNKMLNHLTDNPYIDQAMVYDHQGKIVAQSDNAMTALNQYLNRRQIDSPALETLAIPAELPLDKPTDDTPLNNDKTPAEEVRDDATSTSPAPAIDTEQQHGNRSQSPTHTDKVYITPIYQQQQLLGYLRINYQQQLALVDTQQQHHKTMQQLMLMLLLSGGVGFFLTRGYVRFSRLAFSITRTPND